jgi:hypothetical protein
VRAAASVAEREDLSTEKMYMRARMRSIEAIGQLSCCCLWGVDGEGRGRSGIMKCEAPPPRFRVKLFFKAWKATHFQRCA